MASGPFQIPHEGCCPLGKRSVLDLSYKTARPVSLLRTSLFKREHPFPARGLEVLASKTATSSSSLDASWELQFPGDTLHFIINRCVLYKDSSFVYWSALFLNEIAAGRLYLRTSPEGPKVAEHGKT